MRVLIHTTERYFNERLPPNDASPADLFIDSRHASLWHERHYSILNLMGAELPKQLLGASPDNEAGHWEPERLVSLHDQMLAEAGSSWRDLRPLDLAQLSADRLEYYKSMIYTIIQEEFGNAHVFVLKEPRISRLIPIYRAVLSGLGVRIQPIIILRNPIEVSASSWRVINSRKRMVCCFGLGIASTSRKTQRDMGRVFVNYDHVVNDIPSVITYLRNSLDGYLPLSQNSSEIIHLASQFIRRDLRHQVSSANDVDQNALTQTWINGAYRALSGLAISGEKKSSIARLDSISRELSNATSLLAQLADDVDVLRIKRRQLEDHRRLLLKTIEQLREQIQRTSEQHVYELQQNAEQHAHEVQQIAQQHAHEVRRNAKQHALEVQRNAEQHARKMQQNTEQYARKLAGLQRTDYGNRLPPELAGLRQWLSNRSKRHRRFVQDYHKIAASPLFDGDWYLQKNPDVAAAKVTAALHYLQNGGREGRAPGPYFQANAYLKANPNVSRGRGKSFVAFSRKIQRWRRSYITDIIYVRSRRCCDLRYFLQASAGRAA